MKDVRSAAAEPDGGLSVPLAGLQGFVTGLLDIITISQPHKTNFRPLKAAIRLNTHIKQTRCVYLASSKG